MYMDSHAHLNFPDFNADREEVIRRANLAGVGSMINVGTTIASSRQAIELADRYACIFATAGIHPHDAGGVGDVHMKELEHLLRHPRVVALGEIGLDFYRDYSPHAAQIDIFTRQLRLAVKMKKPVIIHAREAWKEMIPIVTADFKGQLSGVFHCFSGSLENARHVLDSGFHISFTGVVTFRNSVALAIAKYVPIDRLLLETDCPFMAPEPHRGKRCEPAYIPLIAEKIAGAKGMDAKDLGRRTTENVRSLFGIA